MPGFFTMGFIGAKFTWLQGSRAQCGIMVLLMNHVSKS